MRRFLILLGFLVCLASLHGAPARPNIVFILADDLGYGDIGCYGAKAIKTPNIDRLAREGTRLTSFYVSQAVCTASRASLLTGSYANRVGMSGALNHTSTSGISLKEKLLSELFKEKGYATAIYGKWHLGHRDPFLPTRRGFDEWLGIPYSNDNGPLHPVTRGIPSLPLYENEKVIELDPDQSQFTRRLTEKAVDFIERNRRKPFFIYLPHIMPHVPIFASSRFKGRSAAGLYGDAVEELDWSVGEIMAALGKHGLEKNTLLVFTSDNGPFLSYGEHAGSAGALREGKLTTFGGGVQVPCVMRWPAEIPRGRVSDELVTSMDLYVSFARLIGAQLPATKLDGQDLSPLLLGRKGARGRESFWFYSGEELHAVRLGDWKLHLPHEYLTVAAEPGKGGKPSNWENLKPQSIELSGIRGIASRHGYRVEKMGFSLYNVKADPGERTNLADTHPDVVARLQTEVAKARADLGDSLTGVRPTGARPAGNATPPISAVEPQPFGADFPRLDSLAVGEWWKAVPPRQNPPPSMEVPRDQVVAFALYTHEKGVLKLTAQLFPLKPGEPREARVELLRGNKWIEAARATVVYPGWSAHFRLAPWDNSRNVRYRVRHGNAATFEGLIRRDPVDKNEIVVATMSCNSSRTTGDRPEILENLKTQNPDLLFFAGDQTYRHTEHTAGWIEFGLQFRDVMRDRPTVSIPDDHDVGHPNLWGENGKRSIRRDNADGGYFYPVDYVNMVQRQQTWNLPDPVDPNPVERGIEVFFTRLRVGGVDFAIVEDRKFKSGPAGKIPIQGPRPDHITNSLYDPRSIDLPGLHLLGARQEKFLADWGQDWQGAELKALLSATALAGAVHLHGSETNRLLADLDCNGWPQSGRLRALEALRRARAVHLCGDQHLAGVVKHGLKEWGDGPYAFTSPALVNTIYGRWWHPADEKAGANPIRGTPLPWTGDYRDGLGNQISMMAYANPPDIRDERQRGDGYGLARFDKKKRTVTFECWPRFAEVKAGQQAQFPGWPITVKIDDNDGRRPVAWLPELRFSNAKNPVVQVVEESTKEILYTVRVPGDRFQPPVFASGRYTIKVGRDRPGGQVLKGLEAKEKKPAGSRVLRLPNPMD